MMSYMMPKIPLSWQLINTKRKTDIKGLISEATDDRVFETAPHLEHYGTPIYFIYL